MKLFVFIWDHAYLKSPFNRQTIGPNLEQSSCFPLKKHRPEGIHQSKLSWPRDRNIFFHRERHRELCGLFSLNEQEKRENKPQRVTLCPWLSPYMYEIEHVQYCFVLVYVFFLSFQWVSGSDRFIGFAPFFFCFDKRVLLLFTMLSIECMISYHCSFHHFCYCF